jgi:hypothetical protein
MNGELVRMWKDSTRCLSGGTEGKHEQPELG